MQSPLYTGIYVYNQWLPTLSSFKNSIRYHDPNNYVNMAQYNDQPWLVTSIQERRNTKVQKK